MTTPEGQSGADEKLLGDFAFNRASTVPEFAEVDPERNYPGPKGWLDDYDPDEVQKAWETAEQIYQNRDAGVFRSMKAPLLFRVPDFIKEDASLDNFHRIEEAIKFWLHIVRADLEKIAIFLENWEKEMNPDKEEVDEFWQFWRNRVIYITRHSLSSRFYGTRPLEAPSLLPIVEGLEPTINPENATAMRQLASNVRANDVNSFYGPETSKEVMFSPLIIDCDYRDQLLKSSLFQRNQGPYEGTMKVDQNIALYGFKRQPESLLIATIGYNILRHLSPSMVSHVLPIPPCPEGQPVLQAIYRDLGRLFDQSRKLPNPANVPSNVEGPFEDPFHLGKDFYDLLVQQINEYDEDPTPWEEGFIMEAGSKSPFDFERFKNKFFIRRFYYSDLEKQLIEHIRKSCKGRKQSISGWNFRQKALKVIPTYMRLKEFCTIYKYFRPRQKTFEFRKFFKEFFESDPMGDNFEKFAYYYYQDDELRKEFLKLLRTDETCLEAVVQIANNNRYGFVCSFALKVLADYCGTKQPDTKKLTAVIRRLFPTMESFNEQRKSVDLFVFISYFDNPELVIREILRIILLIPGLWHETFLACAKPDTPNPLEDIAKRFPIFADFDQQIFLEEVNKCMTRKNAGKQFIQAFASMEGDLDFDKEEALREIIERTTIPIVEEIEMDCSEILPTSVRLTLLPLDEAHAGLASWRVRIWITWSNVQTLVNEALTVTFRNGNLITDVNKKILDIIEKIGIFAAHKYFVRMRPDGSFEEIVSPRSTPEPETSEPPPPSEPGDDDKSPDSSEGEVRSMNGRKESPLTIDIRDGQQREIVTSRARLLKILRENKTLVERLIKGEREGIDLNDVIIFRRLDGYNPGQYVFEQVSAEDLELYLECGEFVNDEFFMPNSLPFTGALGYHRWRRIIDKETGQHIWGVKKRKRTDNANLAFDNYRESSFPPLSEFTEYDAMIGILTDAHYDPDGFKTVKDENGNPIMKDRLGRPKTNFPYEERDLNARLVRIVRDREWQAEWIEIQRRVLDEELDYIRTSDLSDDEKEAAIAEKEQDFKRFLELMKEMGEGSHLSVKSINGETEVSARIALGWMPTNMSFNQGQYITTAQFAEIIRERG